MIVSLSLSCFEEPVPALLIYSISIFSIKGAELAFPQLLKSIPRTRKPPDPTSIGSPHIDLRREFAVNFSFKKGAKSRIRLFRFDPPQSIPESHPDGELMP